MIELSLSRQAKVNAVRKGWGFLTGNEQKNDKIEVLSKEGS